MPDGTEVGRVAKSDKSETKTWSMPNLQASSDPRL